MTKDKAIIAKMEELIKKLQSMVDSQQDYDRDYHEIWVELASLRLQEEKEVTDKDIEKWAFDESNVNINGDYERGLAQGKALGAKAMRDGKIKPTETI